MMPHGRTVDAENKLALSPPEVARLVGCNAALVYEAIYSGRLAAFRLTEKRLRVPRSAVERWMADLCQQGAVQDGR